MTETKPRGITFFDLDGTLLNNKINLISESTLKALDGLRANAYVICLSTGRDMDTHYSTEYRDIIRPDAIIHQNGGRITVGDETIFRHVMDKALLRRIYDYCTSHDICMGTSIGSKDYFINPDKKTAADKAYNKFIVRNFAPFEDLFTDELEITALSYAGDYYKEKPQIERDLPMLELFSFSSGKGADVVERGFTKAEGMKIICEYYNVAVSDTYSFGDSANDVAILRAAGTGVAMGNADPEAKAAADYVTDDINNNGIYNACVKLGLI